jgi:hypothetical protein
MASLTPDIPKVEIAIVEMTNALRREQKLAAVKTNPQLINAARAYAKFLASKDLFSHSADGRQPAARAADAGYQYCEIAENLAWHRDGNGFETRDLAAKVVSGWMNSPGHRANLLNGHVTDIGVAVAEAPGGAHKFVSVQLLGRPRSAHIQFSISNTAATAVAYSFAGKAHELKPRQTVTHGECVSGALIFSSAKALFSSTKEIARYETSNGAAFIVKSDDKGELRVELSKPAAPKPVEKRK